MARIVEIECIASNFEDEEGDDNNEKIWQRHDGDETGPFYAFQNFMDDE